MANVQSLELCSNCKIHLVTSGQGLKHETGININLSNRIIQRILKVTTTNICNLEKRDHCGSMIPELNYILLEKVKCLLPEVI